MKVVKKSVFCFALSILSIVGTGSLFVAPLYAFSGNPPPYVTGAPGEGTCNAGGCHNSFSTNSGTATFSIAPVKGKAFYTPGKTVKLKVAINNTAISHLHGFEMTAVDSNGNKVGTFKKIGNSTRVISGLPKKDTGAYIEQTLKGGKNTFWIVKWTAPIGTPKIPVTLYAAGVDANKDGKSTGDYVYTTTLVLNPK